MRIRAKVVALAGGAVLAGGCNLISGLSSLSVGDSTSSSTTSGSGATGGTGGTSSSGGTGGTGTAGMSGSTGTTMTDTCNDMTRNNGESDTDCGGPVCKRCQLDQSCGGGSDCESGICSATKCAAATHITAGNAHACALLTTGELYCLGAGTSGQLGNEGHADSAIPVKTVFSDASDPVVEVSAGGLPGDNDSGHTCARTKQNFVFCWGANLQGQLGTGDTQGLPKPPVNPTLKNAKAVSAGGAFSCAIQGDDTVTCWGENTHNELGNGKGGTSTSPVDLDGTTGVTAIATGVRHACRILSDKSLSCWGNNTRGELANPVLADSAKLQQVMGLSGVTGAFAGNDFTCALAGAALSCWGDNSDMELTDAVAAAMATSPAALPVAGVTKIALGADGDADNNDALGGHACAIVAQGKVACWGNNRKGQLGSGAVSDTEGKAVEISGLEGVVEIAAGAEFTCALTDKGAVLCWGRNDRGQLGNGAPPDSQFKPVSVAWP